MIFGILLFVLCIKLVSGSVVCREIFCTSSIYIEDFTIDQTLITIDIDADVVTFIALNTHNTERASLLKSKHFICRRDVCFLILANMSNYSNQVQEL